jgi:hypothetical protein
MKNDMPRLFLASILTAAAGLLIGASSGCRFSQVTTFSSPAAAGLNTRDLIDSAAQDEADDLNPANQLVVAAERLRKDRQQKLGQQSKNEGGVATTQPDRSILCLSGGASFGAYAAGVLVGWSERGDRPCFDVVTGISTGALIAPSAFLGAKYDDQIKRFYTTLSSGESVLARQGLSLTYRPRGPLLPISGPNGLSIPPAYSISDRGSIPATPFQPSAK